MIYICFARKRGFSHDDDDDDEGDGLGTSRAGASTSNIHPTGSQVELLATLDASGPESSGQAADSGDAGTSSLPAGDFGGAVGRPAHRIGGRSGVDPAPSLLPGAAAVGQGSAQPAAAASPAAAVARQTSTSQVSPAGARVNTMSSDDSLSSNTSLNNDISRAYEKVVTWRRNLFNVPLGSAGGDFVDVLTGLIKGFTNGSSLRPVAWKAVGVACHLLLQRPHDSKMMSNYSDHLRRRLTLWKSGRIDDLTTEGESLQDRLKPRYSTSSGGGEKSDITFSNLVFSGKIKSAIRYLSSDSSNDVLGMTDVVDEETGTTVKEALLQKHPPAAEPPVSILLAGDPEPINSIVFQKITPELIRRLGRQMKGSSGPSGLDSDAWCRMLTCYRKSSDGLCTALASFAQCLCSEDLDPEHLSAFTAARLIPLDKHPGVRPIAVGEVFRRLVCRAVMRVLESDVLRATAPMQLCIGVPSACEAGVHAMQDLFAREDTEGILFVDATNAFNSLNRNAALHNVPYVCPAMAKVFQNTYSSSIRLFVSGGGEIESLEGTCQGDPLAMALYGIATVPMIRRLQESNPSVAQVWYADDDSAGGRVSSLSTYWGDISQLGPDYGYFPNPQKSMLLVKPEHEEEAQRLFSATGVTIKTSGNRHLGGAIGSEEFCSAFMAKKVDKWKQVLDSLTGMAVTQPQAAYTVFTKGLSSTWTYHLRCSPCSAEILAELDERINDCLIPALLGDGVRPGSPERELMSFPVRLGGLALPLLQDSAPAELAASLSITKPLVQLLLTGTYANPPSVPGDMARSDLSDTAQSEGSGDTTQEVADRVRLSNHDPVRDAVGDTRQLARSTRTSKMRSLCSRQQDIKADLSSEQQFLVEIASEKGVSSWLTVAPRWQDGTILRKSDFRDALCIRYGRRLSGLPDSCVCGVPLSPAHALTCATGGYTIARHNEVRDLVAGLLREAGVVDVETEPRLLPCSSEHLPGGRSLNRCAEARLDVRARGFWSWQQDAYFDVRITHPAASVLSRSQALSQLKSHERNKKNQYASRVVNVERGSFTPLVFSTYGFSGPETTQFLKSLASLFVERHTELKYPLVMGILRTRLSFCLLRWAVTCFRGCRGSYGKRRQPNSFLAQCRQAE